MPERKALVERFLADAGWADAVREPLAGDLSARRYTRLRRGDGTSILMDAPPGRDRTTPAFLRITRWLREAGLAAPRILHECAEDGLLLLEDLGDLRASLCIADPATARAIYDAATDALSLIAATPPPTGLASPSAADMAGWLAPTRSHYPVDDPAAFDAFAAGLREPLERCLAENRTVALRDFHVDNIMWRPGERGLSRLGLLDYQDAFLCHPAYDLASLLADARVEVPPGIAARCLERFADATGADPGDLSRNVALLSVQRNARILGVFAGSGRYREHWRRVWSHVDRGLSHPSLAHLRPAFRAACPMPEPVGGVLP